MKFPKQAKDTSSKFYNNQTTNEARNNARSKRRRVTTVTAAMLNTAKHTEMYVPSSTRTTSCFITSTNTIPTRALKKTEMIDIIDTVLALVDDDNDTLYISMK